MRPVFLPAILCVISLGAGCSSRTGTVADIHSSLPSNLSPGLAPAVVESWAKPESGWLYVLDIQSQPNEPGARIWLIDPSTAKVMGSIRAGASPDFALSPDGTRLYVASEADGPSSKLAVVDTSDGMIVERESIENRVVANGYPSFSSMAVSQDGLALRILVNGPTPTGSDGFQLATFATRSGRFLPGSVHLGNCGYGQFISYPAADRLDFLCPTTNRIWQVRVNPATREFDNAFVILPWIRRLGVAHAFLTSGGGYATIVRGDGAVFTMNVATAAFAPTPMIGDVQGRIQPSDWPVSPDGTRLYVGLSRMPNRRFYLDYDRSATVNPRTQNADEFRVLDTGTWRTIGTIKTGMPFWTAVSANDGSLLYALAPERHSVMVIDTAARREIRRFNLGGNPSLALVAP